MEIKGFPSIPLKFLENKKSIQNTEDFSKHIGEFIKWVNDQQKQSKGIREAILRGENIPLHQAVIEFEKASLALNLLLQIRNKLLEAFQELKRMQV